MNKTIEELLLELAGRTLCVMRASRLRRVRSVRAADGYGLRRIRTNTMTMPRCYGRPVSKHGQQ